jgi:hypothetical protein
MAADRTDTRRHAECAFAALGHGNAVVATVLPTAIAVAVLGYRRSEIYAALGIDGALAIGAGVAWLI